MTMSLEELQELELQELEELQEFYPFNVFYEEENYSERAKNERDKIIKELKSQGYSDETIDDIILTVLEDNSLMYYEYCEFIENGCEFKEPKPFIKDHVKLPNSKEYTSNKSFKYDIYLIAQLECTYDKYDNKDFLYSNKINDITLSNGLREVKLSKRKIKEGLNKLCNLQIPTIKKEKVKDNKVVYIMNEGNKESYLSVPREQAIELAFLGDMVIKLLVIFNACLYNYKKPRRISQEYLITSLGMSVNGQNRVKIAKAIDLLFKLGYITKHKEQNPRIPTDVCYSYTLNTFEQWKEKSNPISLDKEVEQ